MITLSPEQQAIVNHTGGPALVHAVAGSGKTRVVVERAKLLSNSLVVTFSRSAADEIRRRIGSSRATVSTAHALAFKLMRQPRIDENKFKFMADRMRRDLRRHDIELDELLELITLAKSRLNPVPDPSILHLYWAIEERRLKENIVTFNDLLLFAAKTNIEERKIQFDYVIQDEAQDQNEVQEAFITSCVRDSNYMSVGDPWQTCFEFRGADPKYVSESHFKKKWKGAVVYRLNTNYRSGSAIVAAADAISERRAVASRDVVGAVVFSRFDDVINEANHIATSVAVLMNNDATILYRRHSQAGVIEAALRQHGVPFYSMQPYCELSRVTPLFSYLWMAANRGTIQDVKRSLNKPFRFIPANAAEIIGASCEETWEEHVRNCDVPERCIEWARIIDRLALLAENGAAPVVIVKTLIAALHLENSYGLIDVASMYEDLDDMLDDFFGNQDPNGIRLSSIHEAKGMEFNAVFFVGYESLRWDVKEGCYVEVEGEERRLNYVAFTRAKNLLHVSSIKMEG